MVGEHILVVIRIYFGDCDSFQCYQTLSTTFALKLLDFYSVFPLLALFFYLLVIKYYDFLDSLVFSKTLKDKAVLLSPTISIHLLVILLYNFDVVLQEKYF